MGIDKNNRIAVAELLQTKFCHDLAGVIGAINNGIELMEDDDPVMQKQAAELLSFSAEEALAKLQFFRLIYGITDDISTISPDEFSSLINNFYKKSKIKIHYKGLEQHLPRHFGKLLSNMIYIAATCLIRGGDITVEIMGDAAEITGRADHIKFEDNFKSALEANAENLEEKFIQPYFTGLIAAEKGFVISSSLKDKELKLKISKL